MKTVISSERPNRKLVLICTVLLLSFALSACATKRMIAQEVKPAITAKADKAVLVIVRSTSFGWGNIVDNYLDGKMIGQTYGKVFFITDVKPGVHYVISHADNTDTARLNFETGKIYILQQGIYPGYNITSSFSPMTADQFKKEVQEADYVVYDAQRPGSDMSPKDLKEAKDSFDKELKEGKHKEIVQYKGYRKVK